MTYIEKVKPLVKINKLHFLKEEEIWEIFDMSKAVIFDGHFELLSKKHSDMFFRFAAISQYPYYVARISKEMVAWLHSSCDISKINVILGPTSQGMFFAYDIARELNGTTGSRAVYAAIDKESGRPLKKLVEGFELKSNENVLIVNDMTTTGSGIETLIKLAEDDYGANIMGICIFANRGTEEEKVRKLQTKYNFHSIVELNMPSWQKEECKRRCISDRQIIESKKINTLPIYSEEDAYVRYVEKLRVISGGKTD